MATCPSCNARVADDERSCPTCGKAIPASQLEEIETSTSGWQKFVIIATIVLLIVIGFTFYGAEEREDKAAQANFQEPVQRIVQQTAMQTGVGSRFGAPDLQLKALPKEAEAVVVFPNGPMSQADASRFGRAVAARIAQAYVSKGYMPRQVRVVVAGGESGGQAVYGQAIYNGNIDALGWEPAAVK